MRQNFYQRFVSAPFLRKDRTGEDIWATGASSDRQSHASFLIFLALFAITFSLFFNAVRGEFLTWDDDINITHNPHVQGLDLPRVTWMFTDLQQALRYKPLSWLTWGALYEVNGLDAATFHFGNIVFHALNVGLVFLLISKILRLSRIGEGNRRLSFSVAAIAALLWAIHPLRVEPVAWVTGLPYCQSLFFFLLSLVFYLQFHGSGDSAPNARWYWFSVAAFGLALLSYPVVLGGAAVFVVLDVFVLRRVQIGRDLWRGTKARWVWLQKIPFVLMAIGFVSLALFARVNATGLWSKPQGLNEFGLIERTMQSFYVWAYYFWKPIVPVGLSPLYTTLVRFKPGDWQFVLSAALVIGVTVLVIWQRRRWPAALAFWLCHLCLVVPVLGLTERPHYPSDRYDYIASVAWFVVIAVGAAVVVQRSQWRVPTFAFAAGVAVVFAVISLQQILVWRNTDTLFQRMISTTDDRSMRVPVQRRWGTLLARQGRLDEAAAQFSAALEIEPGFPDLHKRLADVLEAQQKHTEALHHYREATRLDPTLVEARAKAERLASLAGQPPVKE
jgi:hypothetical protein